MANWQYTRGLHDLGSGCFAYLQPDGSWGFSNAGLVVSDGKSLLVDTLMDLKLTGAMLDEMRRKVPESKQIGTLVNTHSNPDHTFGNQLVEGAEIIASEACFEEMKAQDPVMMAGMMAKAAELGEGAKFLRDLMGPPKFDWTGIVATLPTRTFDRELSLRLGSKTLQLVNVGPAHTGGDTMIHIPEDRTVFTGDILFIESHPVIWDGPITNWIAACDKILSWDVETIVPGHGPITDKAGVRRFRGYLVYIRDEARKRFDAGLDPEEAARDISLDPYSDWLDSERLVANVAALYREFGADIDTNVLNAFGMMARYRHHH
jgi:glyoxylase-like metal-dependent hydrolase (beta-lactamase superfamily II)